MIRILFFLFISIIFFYTTSLNAADNDLILLGKKEIKVPVIPGFVLIKDPNSLIFHKTLSYLPPGTKLVGVYSQLDPHPAYEIYIAYFDASPTEIVLPRKGWEKFKAKIASTKKRARNFKNFNTFERVASVKVKGSSIIIIKAIFSIKNNKMVYSGTECTAYLYLQGKVIALDILVFNQRHEAKKVLLWMNSRTKRTFAQLIINNPMTKETEQELATMKLIENIMKILTMISVILGSVLFIFISYKLYTRYPAFRRFIHRGNYP